MREAVRNRMVYGISHCLKEKNLFAVIGISAVFDMVSVFGLFGLFDFFDFSVIIQPLYSAALPVLHCGKSGKSGKFSKFSKFSTPLFPQLSIKHFPKEPPEDSRIVLRYFILFIKFTINWFDLQSGNSDGLFLSFSLFLIAMAYRKKKPYRSMSVLWMSVNYLPKKEKSVA